VRVKAFHSDRFALPLPEGHRFPNGKSRRLRERVSAEPAGIELFEGDAAGDELLGLAHCPDYVDRVSGGALSHDEQRAIGLAWSPQLVERARHSVGATIAACRAALETGIAVNLAGGAHHAQRDRGAGYCVFNDVAVAARLMQAEGAAGRVALVDLDVHQGNGSAAIFACDPRVFTLSLHAANNYPRRKVAGSLDVELPDGCGDADYLDALDRALQAVAARFEPDLVIYLAGADPHEGDRLGRLKLSVAGLRERDRRVLAWVGSTPVAVTMAGGYGRDLETTVEIHLNTVREARRHWLGRRRAAGAEPLLG
jgi:acetoin utilization deacetylase AcuC-like enzyme